MASATSLTTSALRSQRRSGPEPPRALSLSDSMRFVRAAEIAGASPKRTAVTADRPSVNARTTPSTRMSAERGSSVG